jgi:tetratricopeptide (TPR) repeat protein
MRGFWLLLVCALMLACGPMLAAGQDRAAQEDAPFAPSQENPRTLLEQAEMDYRAGEYARAAAAWRAWLETSTDARVEYNLGNCAFRLGDYARALWRYERAARAKPGDAQIDFNRELARRRLGLGEDPAQGFVASVGVWLRQLSRRKCLGWGLGLQLSGLGLAWLARRRRATGALGLGLLVALAGAAALLTGILHPAERSPRAIILEPRTPVLAEPRAELEPRARMGSGVSVEVLEQSPAWLRIRGRGVSGWIERRRAGRY